MEQGSPRETSKVRIRVADWRDWKGVQALRSLLDRPFEGGLYELLHWPIYHSHYAMPLGDDTVVGVSSVILVDSQAAEDYGTAVLPDYRCQGIASQLRLTQVRDLIEMGVSTLFAVAPTPEAVSWLTGYMTPLATLEEGTYFAGDCTDIMTALLDKGVPIPHQLSPANKARLGYKTGRALQDMARLAAYSERAATRAAIREQYLGD